MGDPRLARIRELVNELASLLNDPEPDPELVERPDNLAYIHQDADVELQGIIGRPELKTVRGKALFTAGLKVREGNVSQWHNLQAWGEVAESMRGIERGQLVRVIGRPKESGYVDSEGVMQTKREIQILSLEHVGSVESQSERARA